MILRAIVVAGAWLSVLLAGQQQAPTFRSGVSLVTIDVTVLDAAGKPVPGLTAADLDIKLDGRLQPIRAFAFVQAGTQPEPAAVDAAPAAAPAAAAAPRAFPEPGEPRRTFSNAGAVAASPTGAGAPASPAAAATPPGESRVFVLVVDDLSYAATSGKRLFSAARRFLDRVPAGDPVGFTTTTGIGAINPTRDRAVVRAALERVVGQFDDPRGLRKSGPVGGARQGGGTDSPLGMSESIDIARGDDSLLKDVIARECFNGDRSLVINTTVAVLLRQQCPSDVQREARMVAALANQNKGRQIQGVLSVIRAMKGAGGIRHVVLLSDGLPVSREVSDLHPLVRAAAEAGVQLSVLIEDPDISLSDEGRGGELAAGVRPQPDPGVSRRRREDGLLMVNGLQTMTEMLGGLFHRIAGDPDPFFDRVLLASSAVYRIGVELPAGAKAGDVFDVEVDVKRPGLTGRANRFTVFVPAPDTPPTAGTPATPAAPAAEPPPVPIDDVLKAALNQNTAASAVPIDLAAFVRRSATAPGQVDVNVAVRIPPAVQGPVIAFVGIVDAAGAVRSSRRVLEAPDASGYTTSFLIPLAPGDYRVRFAAAGAARALGTIDVPLRAALQAAGPFTVSDVLTWYVDANNKAQLFALEDVPAGVGVLRASLELYGDLAGAPPVVRWTLTPEGAAAAVSEQEVAAQAGPAFFRSDAQFELAPLRAGRYTIRAEVNGAAVAAVVKMGTGLIFPDRPEN